MSWVGGPRVGPTNSYQSLNIYSSFWWKYNILHLILLVSCCYTSLKNEITALPELSIQFTLKNGISKNKHKCFKLNYFLRVLFCQALLGVVGYSGRVMNWIDCRESRTNQNFIYPSIHKWEFELFAVIGLTFCFPCRDSLF